MKSGFRYVGWVLCGCYLGCTNRIRLYKFKDRPFHSFLNSSNGALICQ